METLLSSTGESVTPQGQNKGTRGQELGEGLWSRMTIEAEKSPSDILSTKFNEARQVMI